MNIHSNFIKQSRKVEKIPWGGVRIKKKLQKSNWTFQDSPKCNVKFKCFYKFPKGGPKGGQIIIFPNSEEKKLLEEGEQDNNGLFHVFRTFLIQIPP